jgi:hypothetical protein
MHWDSWLVRWQDGQVLCCLKWIMRVPAGQTPHTVALGFGCGVAMCLQLLHTQSTVVTQCQGRRTLRADAMPGTCLATDSCHCCLGPPLSFLEA